MPDMNEMFWQPGGNENLLAEQGWNVNQSVLVKYHGSNNDWSTKINLYHNNINNWIQWQPTEFGYWSPRNYKQVKSTGAELELKWTTALAKSQLLLMHRTNYNEAQGTNKVGHWNNANVFRMTNSPKVLVYNEAKWILDKTHFYISHKYTSTRFTDEENTERNALAPYHLFNAGAEYQWQSNKSQWQMGLTIENIFNTAFQSVRSYAMPGRIIQLHLQIQLQQNNTNK
jgi:iron complex outermembrane receptor protein